MKSLPGLVGSKSFEIRRQGSYEDVALEYYDQVLHPAGAVFRVASRLFLRTFFGTQKPTGRIADIGCGFSIVSELVDRNLVLVDSSVRMLARNVGSVEKRLA